MAPTSLVVAVARTGKIIKNGLSVFEREENLLQIGTLRLGSADCQKLRWKVRIYVVSERGLALKG